MRLPIWDFVLLGCILVSIEIHSCIRTLRLKVKAEGCAWLNAAAIEVNQVWIYANETSYKAARPYAGPSKWLSAFDLNNLTSGATEWFEQIGADTIQWVNAAFATARRGAKKLNLKWRASKGAKRSLGWVPFKAVQLKLKCRCIRFSGKAFRVFEQERLQGVRWKSGCFAQAAVGDWWLCVPVAYTVARIPAPKADLGIDLGLKTTAATSDGDKLEAAHFYRSVEVKIAQAQRRGHKDQAKRLHRTAARRRQDALHKFSTKIVKEYQTIYVGDVSSLKLVKTPRAKSVLDASIKCSVTHERDDNSARNVRFVGRSLPSVSRNEPPLSVAEPRQTSYRCEARISTQKAAA